MGRLFVKWIPFFLCLITTTLTSLLYAENFLWTDSYAFPANNGKTDRALIWIPPSAQGGIKGIIVAGQTSAEYSFTRDPEIRAMASSQKLAIIHIYPSTITSLNASDTSLFLNALNGLARQTGFDEIRTVPWLAFGNSAGSTFCLNLGYWHPERTAGIIVYKGGIVDKPSWTKGSLNHIPILAVQGEFEEFGEQTKNDDIGDSSFIKVIRDALALRNQNLNEMLIAPLICSGEGHMGYSKRAKPLLAEFISKAFQRRLASSDGKSLQALTAADGWLAGSNLKESRGSVSIEAYSPSSQLVNKFWLFDKEFAQNWFDFHQELKKKRQRVSPYPLKPTIEPSTSTFLYQVASKSFEATTPIWKTHTVKASASSGLPVYLALQSGPGIVNNNTFIFNPCEAEEEWTIRLILRSDGDATYSPNERMLKVRRLTHTGAPNLLAIKTKYPVLKVGESLSLEGDASSGLPVFYNVLSGPGIVNGNTLTVQAFATRTGLGRIMMQAGQAGDGKTGIATVVNFEIQVHSDGSGIGRYALRTRPNNQNKLRLQFLPRQLEEGRREPSQGLKVWNFVGRIQ